MTSDKRSSAGLAPLEVLGLVCAAAVLALEGGLWLWAGTAGALFGSGWPHLSLGGLWHAITGVGGHLSDPRLGFPASVRPGLPGPAGFYAALVLLAVLLGVMTAAAIQVWERVGVQVVSW